MLRGDRGGYPRPARSRRVEHGRLDHACSSHADCPGGCGPLVGVAAAPDFTEDGMWTRMSDSERHALATRGVIHVPSQYSDEPYPVTWRLVEDGRKRLQLRDRIPLDCPVRLIHGYRDEDVPWQTSFRLASRLRSSDVTVEIVGDGEHRLSRDADLARLARTLHGVLGYRGT